MKHIQHKIRMAWRLWRFRRHQGRKIRELEAELRSLRLLIRHLGPRHGDHNRPKENDE